ncbi:hypothetical protein QE400_000190 [Xanthomonas sacchari]|uniref:hypothetical protein n=1 Tax=Xanthomonas sacchari TaxID=56458 RepID=UPI0027846F23|nr:hypothetical protein [Xanthomonas sacchari]MDQ1090777.1 hypothetical protein [Xanthomonas sacchari]
MESTPSPVSQRLPATRLFALLARESRTGVIFRRGPSKQVQLIHWDLRDDSFVHGQWFKGRIYERRYDLSPSGRLLVYFASKQHGDFGTWTALSRPPFFTALALWPKGDSWGGGGMFEDERTLLLNHRPRDGRDPFPMPTGFQLPHDLQVRPFGTDSGGGEDEPIDGVLRERDGWQLRDAGEGERGGLRSDALFRFSRPRVREKLGANGRRLQSLLHAVGQDNHAWYGQDHRVLDRDGNRAGRSAGQRLGRVGWRRPGVRTRWRALSPAQERLSRSGTAGYAGVPVATRLQRRALRATGADRGCAEVLRRPVRGAFTRQLRATHRTMGDASWSALNNDQWYSVIHAAPHQRADEAKSLGRS